MSESTTADGENWATEVYRFNRGDETADPEMAVVRRFSNQYGDERVAIETPAPWETPDGMTGANEVIKGLDWDDCHYSFEESLPRYDLENVWVIDADGRDALRSAAGAAGYELVDARGAPRDETPERLRELAEDVEVAEAEFEPGEGHQWVGGDRVRVVYESKQSGREMEKEGVVTTAESGRDSRRLTAGIAFERDDGKSNKVKADDGGAVGVYSTGRYPFMGEVRRVEVLPRDA